MIELKANKFRKKDLILLTKRLRENKPMVMVAFTERVCSFSCCSKVDLKEVEMFLKKKGIKRESDFISGILPILHENDPTTAYGFCTIKAGLDILEELREYYYVALWFDNWKWIIK